MEDKTWYHNTSPSSSSSNHCQPMEDKHDIVSTSASSIRLCIIYWHIWSFRLQSLPHFIDFSSNVFSPWSFNKQISSFFIIFIWTHNIPTLTLCHLRQTGSTPYVWSNYFKTCIHAVIEIKVSCLFKNRLYISTPLNCVTTYSASKPYISIWRNVRPISINSEAEE